MRPNPIILLHIDILRPVLSITNRLKISQPRLLVVSADMAFISIQPRGTMRCPSCGNADIRKDSALAELYCNRCGHILEELMPDVADLVGVRVGEYDTRVFEADDYTLPNKGRSTIMLGMGLRTNPGKMYNMVNLSDRVERSFMHALPSLNLVWMRARRERIFHRHVVQASAMMYRKCIRAKIVRGRDPDAMALAVFHAAMEICGYRHDMKVGAAELDIDTAVADRYLTVVKKVLQKQKRNSH